MNLTNKNGFTLIEVLVSIVILMVGMLGLLQAVNLAIRENMKTVYRTEAVELADQAMVELKRKTFDLISTVPPITNPNRRVVSSNIRSTFSNYSVVTLGTIISGTLAEPRTKEIDITISWRYRGIRYDHMISSMVSSNEL